MITNYKLSTLMDPSSSIYLLIFLILLSGFFSGSETALISLSPANVLTLIRQKKKGAKLVEKLKKNPQRLLITILIGNNLVNIAASVVATHSAEVLFRSKALSVVIGVMTFLILVFGEIVPKTLAQRFNKSISRTVSPFLYFFQLILLPIIVVLEQISHFFITLSGGKEKEKEFTEEEVKAMVDLGHKEGEIETHEKEMIKSIFEYGETTAEEIMTPEKEIEAFDEEINIKEVTHRVLKKTHSRFPVYAKNIDNITGVITLRDILNGIKTKSPSKKIKDLELHKPLIVPLSKPIYKLLKDFQKKRVQIAIVIDEFGSTVGLISVEDILEEIVGEIVDEYDREKAPVKKINSHTLIADGNATLEEIFELKRFRTKIPTHKTISFLVLEKLGRFPREGEKIKVSGVGITVEKKKGNLIQSVKITFRKAKK
ncbi:MAG TPA: HlyC/CorC family transporter [Candidatus Peregrinibacteria bacterium]|nr:HlyC/CorC family transporter [Candidatus Peregrinibacteria bacterium]